jgi:hypothetical protein
MVCHNAATQRLLFSSMVSSAFTRTVLGVLWVLRATDLSSRDLDETRRALCIVVHVYAHPNPTLAGIQHPKQVPVQPPTH